jgi:hypothetical protein
VIKKAGTTTDFQQSAHGEWYGRYGIARDGTTNYQLRRPCLSPCRLSATGPKKQKFLRRFSFFF